MASRFDMKILCWNCQGFGNPLTVHKLKWMYKSLSHDLLFISETKNSDHFVRRKLNSCNFVNMFLVSPLGQAEGLVLA